MKFALAQINPTVGDIAGNTQQILDALQAARGQQVDVVVFPELAVIGYPPKDLLLKPVVIRQCEQAIQKIAAACDDKIAAIVGVPLFSLLTHGKTLINAAAFCHDGKVFQKIAKTLLPTYDVFDEHRYFEPGTEPGIITHKGIKIGVSICEDLWNNNEVFDRQLYFKDPIEHLAKLGADVIVNCSASPFVTGKQAFRRRLFTSVCSIHRIPLLYCNQVGGNDELVFDGNSAAVDGKGNLIALARDFEPDLLVVDLPLLEFGKGQEAPVQRVENPKEGLESIYHTLVLGIRDYCLKCGFKSIVLGLSGGIDSALCAALAVGALGKENIRGVAMPSRFSSDHSVNDARDLADRLGIKFHVIPIAEPHQALEGLLTPNFEGRAADTTEENLQARIRGVMLMAFSNKFGSLLLTTGNKSELAVGYCTLYGDMCGGLAGISDVPKTVVWALSRWINSDPASPLIKEFSGPVIPENSIGKVPSAELRPNQTDQDSLPEYPVLDEIVERYVEKEQTAGQIIMSMPQVDPAVILKMVRLIDINEYKRKQSAPGIKISGRAFGFGRRLPIAQRYDHHKTLEDNLK